MMPRLVVPEVATTAKASRPPGPDRSFASACATAPPVRQPAASGCTAMRSTSMAAAALLMEECASALAATAHLGSPEPPPSAGWAPRERRSRASKRAATSADRLPSVPPCTKTPPAPAGKPARSASHLRAWFSAKTAPAPFEPTAAVEGRSAHDEVEQAARRRGGTRDEREVPRMVYRQARRRQGFGEDPKGALAAHAVLGDRLACGGLQLGRRPRAVEGRWPEVETLCRVGEDAGGERFGGFVPFVHVPYRACS